MVPRHIFETFISVLGNVVYFIFFFRFKVAKRQRYKVIFQIEMRQGENIDKMKSKKKRKRLKGKNL